MANNVFKVKRSSVPGKIPTTSDLSIGELGINLNDQILYSTNGSIVFEIGANNRTASVTGNLTVNSIIANGSLGTDGQILTSNGTTVYWSSSSGGGFSNGASISVNNFAVTGAFSANNSNGSVGQILASNGTGVYWSNGTSRIYSNTVATAGQNTFVSNTAFDVLDVYYNGVHLSGSDYTVVNSTAIQLNLAAGASNGDIVELVGYSGINISLVTPSGNLVVGGANTQVQFNDSVSANGVSGLTFNKITNALTIGGIAQYSGLSQNTTGTSVQTVDSWQLATYRSGQYIVSITDNIANNYQTETLQLITDGTNVYITEYGQMYTNTALGSFSASSNTTHALLRYTPTSAATTVKMARTLVSV